MREVSLGLLDMFRKRREETEMKVESEGAATELEKLLANSQETYEALRNTMFLDPRKVDISLSDAAEQAKQHEKEGDLVKAKVWYEIAGGLAIHKGDVKKVAEYFKKCEGVAQGTKYTILKNPEEAVAKAQEYYKQFLKG